jgi:hypothetical protein
MGNSVHPSGEFALALEVLDALVNSYKGILEHIIGIVMGDHNFPDVPIQLFLVCIEQHTKGAFFGFGAL